MRGALAPAVLALALLAGGLAVAQAGRTDVRVDALGVHALLTASPAVLVDPNHQRRARVIADYQQVTFVLWALAPLPALLLLWRSGNAARLRDLLARRLPSVWGRRAAFGAVLGTVGTLAQAPFAFASYRIASGAGLSTQPVGGWLLDELVILATIAACEAAVVSVVLALVDRTRLWYLAFIAVLYAAAIVVVAVEPVLLAPLASTVRPAPAAVVAEGDAIARAVGAQPVPIEIADTSTRSNALSARAAGVFAFDRIVLGDTTVARLTPGERAFLLARLYAHLRDHDTLLLSLLAATLFVVAAALAVLTSDRIGFRRDDDPLARLPLVGTFLGLALCALYPVFNAVERRIEDRADRAAIVATADPASGVRFLVRRADDDLLPLCGRRSSRWYFAPTAPLGSRIARLRGTHDPCRP